MAYIYERVAGRKFEEFIAYLDNVQFEVDTRAVEIAERGENLLQDHRVDGVAHMEVEKGDIDAYAVLVDSNITNGEDADSNSALSIEFGRAGWIDQDGKTWGEMEGLGILASAAHLPKVHGKRSAKRRRDRAKRDPLTGKFSKGD